MPELPVNLPARLSRVLLCVAVTLSVVPAAVGLFQVAPKPAPPSNEDGYRANNRGVALLEQYRFDAALAELQKAVALLPRYAQARINLAIAQLYAPDLASARRSAEQAASLDPRSPQPPYLLGLIARADGRADDAIRELERVRALDPDDVGVNVNLGQVQLEARRFAEAIALFEAATRAEPYNVTAAYGLGTALLRAGRRDEGAAVLARFEKLRDSPYKTQLGRNYLEQGRYAEALASTGAEAELVDPRPPQLAFRADADALPAIARRFRGRDAATGRARLRSRRGPRTCWSQQVPSCCCFATTAVASPTRARRRACAENARAPRSAGDLDNDGRADLLLLGPLALLKSDGARFVDVTATDAASGGRVRRRGGAGRPRSRRRPRRGAGRPRRPTAPEQRRRDVRRHHGRERARRRRRRLRARAVRLRQPSRHGPAGRAPRRAAAAVPEPARRHFRGRGRGHAAAPPAGAGRRRGRH
jgi:Tfp pilus assembly protein PilF